MLESVFNNVAGLQLSCEYYEIFKNSFFHKTPAVAPCDNSKIFQENITGGVVTDLFF